MREARIEAKDLARPTIESLQRYSAGPVVTTNLSDNTNQWGMPPAAAAAVRDALDASRYPDMYGDSLKDAIAAKAGVDPACVVTGNGSDDVLDCTIRAFAEPGDVIAHPDPTFYMVPVFSRISGVRSAPVPLKPDFTMDVDALLATNARITYLCSPNNPTGTATPPGEIRRVIANARGLVIVDEAYAEFSEHEGFLSAAPSLDRVVVCRTFSKAYGLAGLRVGYGVTTPAIATTIEKLRGPFKLNAMAERVAVAALTRDAEWVTARARDAVDARTQLERELRALGFAPVPSSTNFLLIPTDRAVAIGEALLTNGIAVRVFRGLTGIGDAFRMTAVPNPVAERVLRVLRDMR